MSGPTYENTLSPTSPGTAIPETFVIGGGTAAEMLAEGDSIRPFRVNVSEAKLDDLRRRILATNFPERETVADQSQGVQLATIREARALLGDRL